MIDIGKRFPSTNRLRGPVQPFPSRSLVHAAEFLRDWQKRRTRAAAFFITIISMTGKTIAIFVVLWAHLPTYVILALLLSVVSSLISLVATLYRDEPLVFVWQPLYFGAWISSVFVLLATGGLHSYLLFPYLAIYFVLGLAIQNDVKIGVIVAFVFINLLAWIAWEKVAPTTFAIPMSAAVILCLIISCGTASTLFLPLRSEAALAVEVVKATEALAQARVEIAQLSEVNEAKRLFMANANHELRTPLAAIVGLADIMIDGATDSVEQKAIALRLRRQAHSLAQIVTDLLDYAERETTPNSFERKSVDIRGLLATYSPVWSDEAQAKGLGFTLTLAEDVPETLLSDRTTLVRILTHIMSNAIKFTAVGKVDVRVFVKYEADDSLARRLIVSVTDTGVGIAKENMERIFEPLTQLDPSHKRQYGGMGMGLALARALARLLGGDLRLAASLVGRGSTFELVLPLSGEPWHLEKSSDDCPQ